MVDCTALLRRAGAGRNRLKLLLFSLWALMILGACACLPVVYARDRRSLRRYVGPVLEWMVLMLVFASACVNARDAKLLCALQRESK